MADITNSQLAQKINDLIAHWQGRQDEFAEWIDGTVGGGANTDGRYPLTDYLGAARLTTCPAQLEDDVLGAVASAETAQTGSETAETNAAASAVAALASEVAAQLAQALAETAQTNAAASASGAVTAKVTAVVNAGAAISAKTAAELAETNAATSETNAAASAAAALASEIAAATFDPALYATLSGATFTGAITLNANLNHLIDGTDGFRLYADSATKRSSLRPRNAAGTGWDSAADLQYDRNLGEWNFEKPLKVEGNLVWDAADFDIADYLTTATAAATYAALSHSHAISDVTSLQTTLDGKAASSHTHVVADITDFPSVSDHTISTRNTKTASYTVDETDMGETIWIGNSYTLTIPDDADIPINSWFIIQTKPTSSISLAVGGAGAMTVRHQEGGSVTDKTTGSFTVAQGSTVYCYKSFSSTWLITGNGIS